MKHTPISFNSDMVQAILEGRKTQTRRVVKTRSYIADVIEGIPYEMTEDDLQPIKFPYGEPGDILWVRETFYVYGNWEQVGFYPDTCYPKYEFKQQVSPEGEMYRFNKPSSINCSISSILGWYECQSQFMPHNIARIFLRISNIRVERLEDISEDDAKAEGVEYFKGGTFWWRNYTENGLPGFSSAKQSFQSLWKSIYGDRSWNGNPFVWVVEFERIENPAP